MVVEGEGVTDGVVVTDVDGVVAHCFSLSFAATGAGIAWAVTSDGSQPYPPAIVGPISDQASKGDRLDAPPTKSDRLKTILGNGAQNAGVIISTNGERSTFIFHSPLAMASAR